MYTVYVAKDQENLIRYAVSTTDRYGISEARGRVRSIITPEVWDAERLHIEPHSRHESAESARQTAKELLSGEHVLPRSLRITEYKRVINRRYTGSTKTDEDKSLTRVYGLYHGEELLYVGVTSPNCRRYGHHKSALNLGKHRNAAFQEWYDTHKVLPVEKTLVEDYMTRKEALETERRLIQTMRPLFNTYGTR